MRHNLVEGQHDVLLQMNVQQKGYFSLNLFRLGAHLRSAYRNMHERLVILVPDFYNTHRV